MAKFHDSRQSRSNITLYNISPTIIAKFHDSRGNIVSYNIAPRIIAKFHDSRGNIVSYNIAPRIMKFSPMQEGQEYCIQFVYSTLLSFS